MAKEKFQKVKTANGGKSQNAGIVRNAHDGDNKREAVEFRPFPSVQSQLFDYLRKEQQEYVRPVLRAFKKKMQVKLCVALLDYMETGKAEIPENVQVGAAFMFLTRYGLPEDDNASDCRIIRPFVISKTLS